MSLEPVNSTMASSASKIGDASKLKLDVTSTQGADGEAFRAALDRQSQSPSSNAPAKSDNKVSLGDKIIQRADTLAGEIKNDQKYVSKMLEQATKTGDSMQLMKAMMALNDYQLRVQFVSKTVSKATTSLDSLTKLQ